MAQTRAVPSHEVLRRAVDAVGVKRVASDLDVSTSLVYKWCEAPKADEDDVRSGARNPLDRLVALVDTTGDVDVIAWLCEQAGGYFVEDSAVHPREFDQEYITHTNQLMQDFSALLGVMTESIRDDGRIDPAEARAIRAKWQDLKRFGEQFVRACERGAFDCESQQPS